MGTPHDLPSGCGSSISEGNMMAYVATIEGRTNELLKIYDSIKDGEDDFETTRPRANNSALQVNKLPSTVEDYSDDEDDDDEDDQRPFTIEELKAKTRKKTSRKQKKSRMKGGA